MDDPRRGRPETGWHTLRPVEADFLDEAPTRVAVEASSSLPRSRVWAAFVDAKSWPAWWPRVRAADYPDQEPPYGVGTIRTADVDGQLFEETILTWDEPRTWTYRIDRCTTPLAYAQVESTELADTPEGGTRIRWILASDPRPELAGAAAALPAILTRLLERAMRNLEAHVAEAGT